MRWKGRARSSNIDDRRGVGASRGRMAMGGGIGTVVIIVVVMLLGGDPMALLSQMGGGGNAGLSGGPTAEQALDPAQDEVAQMVGVVLKDTENVWNDLFRRAGRTYQEPTLVLFNGQVRSACGFASAASGPFYCPGDSRVYIDLGFYDELSRRFQAPGDFAQAYVVAHEVGHHVQNLLGITDRVHAQRGRLSEAEYNQLSVRLELQADFLAGVWAHHTQRATQFLEEGDVEEALRAATAIGDDTIQKRSRGIVVPESFTHGTAAQRVRWFRKGLETGDIEAGDTFSTDDL